MRVLRHGTGVILELSQPGRNRERSMSLPARSPGPQLAPGIIALKKGSKLMKALTAAFAILAASSLSVAGSTRAGAAEADSLAVVEMKFCVDIDGRTCAGENTQFFGRAERIWCWTRITGATDTLMVRHMWYYGDELEAEVKLPVKSASWRTWSSKRMIDAWSGAWRVDVVGPDGTVLRSGEFVYKPLSRQ